VVVELLFCLKTREVETYQDIWTSQDNNIVRGTINDKSNIFRNPAMFLLSACIAECNTKRTVKQ